MRRSILFLPILLTAAAAHAETPPSSPWAALARADVEAIHANVLAIHPAVRDPQSADFTARTDAAYRAAIDRAAQVRSFLDWRGVINGFVQSFRDGHTFIRYNAQPSRARWPGFLIDGRGDGYVAAALADTTQAISAGDPVIACDGQPIKTLLNEKLDAREADWSKPPERIRQAWRLFVDYDVDAPPPVARCTFAHKGQPIEVALNWTQENPLTLLQRAAPLLRTPPNHRPIALSYRPDGAALVTIGSFGDESALEALAKTLKTDQVRLRAARYVVFDLRGNRGGNSTWGGTYGRILFGDAPVDALEEPASGKYFRASPQAVARLRLIAKEFADDGPGMADVVAYWTKIADRVAASPDGDAKLFTDFVNPPAKKPKRPPRRAYRGPVYILTDAGCFSSCVVAANTLIKLGGINVGEVMGQNEEYGEVAGPIDLPSGLGRYWLPVSIIRQRKEDLGGLAVAKAWTGAMDDDAGIFTWIAGLAGAGPAKPD
jgi:hypothetical protein